MRFVRKYIYRMGFRPEPGSMFYSPTRAWYLGVNEALAKVGRTW